MFEIPGPARENFETESARPRRIFRSSRPSPEPNGRGFKHWSYLGSIDHEADAGNVCGARISADEGEAVARPLPTQQTDPLLDVAHHRKVLEGHASVRINLSTVFIGKLNH